MSRLPLTPLVIGLAACAAIYLGFTATHHLLQNHQLRQDEARTRADIARLDDDRRELEAVRDYLKSDEYIEDVARRTLGLVKPGETLAIVSSSVSPTPAPSPPPGADTTPAAEWWRSLYLPTPAPRP